VLRNVQIIGIQTLPR